MAGENDKQKSVADGSSPSMDAIMKQILEATQNNNAIVTRMEATIETLQARVASLELRDPTPSQPSGSQHLHHDLEGNGASFNSMVATTKVSDYTMVGTSSVMSGTLAMG